MSRTGKWVVGILVGLVLLAAVLSVSFLAGQRMNGVARVLRQNPAQRWDGGRVRPWDQTPWDDMPMHRMMPFGFFGGYFPFRSLLVGLMCLVIPLLIVLGIVALVLALTRSSRKGNESAPVKSSTEAAELVEAGTLSRACPNCGRPVNAEWSHCPYCGTGLNPAE